MINVFLFISNLWWCKDCRWLRSIHYTNLLLFTEFTLFMFFKRPFRLFNSGGECIAVVSLGDASLWISNWAYQLLMDSSSSESNVWMALSDCRVSTRSIFLLLECNIESLSNLVVGCMNWYAGGSTIVTCLPLCLLPSNLVILLSLPLFLLFLLSEQLSVCASELLILSFGSVLSVPLFVRSTDKNVAFLCKLLEIDRFLNWFLVLLLFGNRELKSVLFIG